eukprot:7409707-Karenia_brevis.AAC.1
MRHVLLNKEIAIKKRLKVFDSTVTNCALWCTESWTPRVEELRKLRVNQRAMLRRIVGVRRQPEEQWVQWVRRVTAPTLNIARESRVRDWIDTHFERKWAWAGHVARRPYSAWTWKVTFWRDSSWQAWAQEWGNQRPLRPSRRRWMKFEDVLRRFCTQKGLGEWNRMSKNKTDWLLQSKEFTSWAKLS